MPTPRKVNGNSNGGGGVTKAQFSEGLSMTVKGNFRVGWGGGVQFKKPSMEGVWIFSRTHCQ